MWGLPGGSAGKEPTCGAGDTGDAGSLPGSGRSPGGGHGNPLQCSCLENPTDVGAWQAAVHGSQRVRHDRSDLARWTCRECVIECVRWAHLECDNCSLRGGQNRSPRGCVECVRPSVRIGHPSSESARPSSPLTSLAVCSFSFLPSDPMPVCSQQMSAEHPLGARPGFVKRSRTEWV